MPYVAPHPRGPIVSRGSRLVAALVFAVCVLSANFTAHADERKDAIRAFHKTMKSEKDWKARVDALNTLAFYDGPGLVDVILDGAIADEHPSVHRAAALMLSRLITPEAKDELVAELKKAKGRRMLVVMLALRQQMGKDGLDVVRKIADGKDLRAACQALIVMGQKQSVDDVSRLLEALASSHWQVRRAAAQALRLLAGEPPTKKKNPEGKMVLEEGDPPWVPEWYPQDKVLPALVDGLEKPLGAERHDIVRTLHRITEQNYAYDVAAWRKLIGGEKPEAIESKPRLHPTHLFGVPIYGKRIVVVVDNAQQTDDPHGYSREFLQSLCVVPGARPIPWYQLKTKRQFIHACVRRFVQDKKDGTQFDVYFLTQSVTKANGKLVKANAASKKKAFTLIEKAKTSTGQDTMQGLLDAFMAGGKKDKHIWTKGPDEILYVASTVPWASPVIDQDHIGAEIGFLASWHQIPVHTVGVGPHAFAMFQAISEAAGGVYRSLNP